MLSLFREQPRAFHMLFFVELWERFGFYTVQGILTLYFIRFLGYSDIIAYYTFGAFSALVYGLVVIGGFLGDKVLGTKRTIVVGLVVLAFGYSFLALADKNNVFLALGFICVGNGLFKANPANLLGKCYKPGDARLHGAFTLYYMAVNIGSIAALIIGPTIASRYGYSPAYMFSACGLLLGLANYIWQRQYIAQVPTQSDHKRISIIQWGLLGCGVVLVAWSAAYLLQHILFAQNLLWLVTFSACSYFFYLMSKEDKYTRIKMLMAFILMLEAIVFFVLYQQMPTSLNLFAVNNVHAQLFGIAIDPQTFQVLNPVWIIIMSPLLALGYKVLHKKNKVFAVPHKFALGMSLCGISFLILYCSRYFYSGNGMVSSWWLIGSYFFQSMGELLVSALGTAMVAELVPASIAGFVMGIWFLTSAVAGFLGATVASYTALPQHIKPGVESLIIYTDVFAYIGGVTLVIALLMWLFAPLLSRYIAIKKEEVEESSNETLMSLSNVS